MTIKEVLQIGNPKLRELSSDVEDFGAELEKIAGDLGDTLTYVQEKQKIGRALAAPQIGYMKKVIFFRLPNKSFVMVNPKIVWKSEDMFKVWDSCFSFESAFFVEIDRHKSIKVDYQDESGEQKTEEFSSDLSELVQHEVDHLYGILATDHLKDLKKIVMRSEWESRYK